MTRAKKSQALMELKETNNKQEYTIQEFKPLYHF